MLFCPEATQSLKEGAQNPFAAWDAPAMSSPTWEWQEYDYDGSYGSNSYIYRTGYHADLWRTANVKDAAEIPVLLDAASIGGWPTPYDEPPEYDGEINYQNLALSYMKMFCLNRHGGATNGLFMDFSARRIGLKELWTLKWGRDYDTCGLWTTCGGVQPEDWPEWMRTFEDY